VGVLRPTRVRISTGFDLDEVASRTHEGGPSAPASWVGNIREEVIDAGKNDNAIAARKQSGNTEEDRNRPPKLTSWGCVTRTASNLFSKLSLPKSWSAAKPSDHASNYGFSSAGIGSRFSIFRISFGACFRNRRFISGVNSRSRSLIASELRAPAKRFSVSPKVRSGLG
jgi:hypothetical protein